MTQFWEYIGISAVSGFAGGVTVSWLQEKLSNRTWRVRLFGDRTLR